MADHHYKHGFVSEACDFYIKCPTQNVKATQAAFEAGPAKTSELARLLQDPEQNTDGQRLEVFCYRLMNKLVRKDKAKVKEAAELLARCSNLELSNDFSAIISRKDMAIYSILLTLSQCSRAELKNLVITNAALKQIREAYPDAETVYDDFLNFRFEQLQVCMAGMQKNMKFDMIFGEHAEAHKIFKNIRMKAIRMYFEPYSAIDLKEVAKAF